jgi:hypothetical protein
MDTVPASSPPSYKSSTLPPPAYSLGSFVKQPFVQQPFVPLTPKETYHGDVIKTLTSNCNITKLFSVSDGTLYSGENIGSFMKIKKWNTEDWSSEEFPTKNCIAFVVSPSGDIVWFESKKNLLKQPLVKIKMIKNGEKNIKEFDYKFNWKKYKINDLIIHPTKSLIALHTSKDNSVLIINLLNNTSKSFEFNDVDEKFNYMVFCGENIFIVFEKWLYKYKITINDKLIETEQPKIKGIKCKRANINNDRLFCSNDDKSILIYDLKDLNNFKLVEDVPLKEIGEVWLNGLMDATDEYNAYVINRYIEVIDIKVRVFDSKNNKIIYDFPVPEEHFNKFNESTCLIISKDKQYIFLGIDNNIVIFDLKSIINNSQHVLTSYKRGSNHTTRLSSFLRKQEKREKEEKERRKREEEEEEERRKREEKEKEIKKEINKILSHKEKPKRLQPMIDYANKYGNVEIEWNIEGYPNATAFDINSAEGQIINNNTYYRRDFTDQIDYILLDTALIRSKKTDLARFSPLGRDTVDYIRKYVKNIKIKDTKEIIWTNNPFDAEGNLIDAEGNRIDAEGNRIDDEGNRIDDQGGIILGGSKYNKTHKKKKHYKRKTTRREKIRKTKRRYYFKKQRKTRKRFIR